MAEIGAILGKVRPCWTSKWNASESDKMKNAKIISRILRHFIAIGGEQNEST